MTDFTRAELVEFWDAWLQVNRKAEELGDWTIMADFYKDDANYGWMYSPNDQFMAMNRDQIRDWALGTEMSGLEGWHYDYVATVLDETTGMIVGFWTQTSGIIDDTTGEEFEMLGIGGSWFAVERDDDGALRFAWQRDWFDMGANTHGMMRIASAGKLTPGMKKRMETPTSEMPGRFSYQDLPSTIWPEPVAAGKYKTQGSFNGLRS